MATFTVTHHQRLSNVAVVQTLENTDIAVGQSITLTGLGHGLNGTHIVFAVPTYYLIDVDEEGDYIYDPDVIIPNQLLFQDAGDDLERSAADPVGSLVWNPVCTWIDVADLTEFLGISGATANDTAFMTSSVNASNAWSFKRRVQAGYHDSLTTVPDAAVKAGAVLMAASLYRERGSIDSFQSFQDMTSQRTCRVNGPNQPAPRHQEIASGMRWQASSQTRSTLSRRRSQLLDLFLLPIHATLALWWCSLSFLHSHRLTTRQRTSQSISECWARHPATKTQLTTFSESLTRS
jgi:hypothetical protein